MVECFLAKEDVAGSTPVSRSKKALPATLHLQFSRAIISIAHPEARYPSGKGEVCKTFMRRFDPDPRLQFLSNTYNDCRGSDAATALPTRGKSLEMIEVSASAVAGAPLSCPLTNDAAESADLSRTRA